MKLTISYEGTHFAGWQIQPQARTVQQTLEREDMMPRVQRVGAELRGALEERFGQHPRVGDIRGRGLFIGIELVADRESRAPFDPELKLHQKIKKAALEGGLICYPGGGCADGRAGDHVLLAPPFIYESNHVEELIDKLDAAIEAALTEAGA